MTDEPPATLADRLRDVRVGLRPELDFSRHIFRGEVSYIVRDPITFQSHRLDLADYSVVVEINEERSLHTVFSNLVANESLDAEDEEKFYEFIVSLHQLGVLNLPFSDGDRLYRRFVAKRNAAKKQRLTGIFFFKVPLINPDAFLTRTMSIARFAFTKPFLIFWIALQCFALYLLASHWGRFIEQFDGFFQLRNLALLWGTMIGLKVFHEFGHAYACKRFQGHVPEMGAFFILFTPCAYVDATSSWAFTRKWQRLVVNFGGMYFELTIAAFAMIGWCLASPGVTSSFFHNVVFLASVLTIGFNVNPLMRFDGYYAMSDALEIPNLRQRATGAVQSLLKRTILGIDDGRCQGAPRMRVILCVYGVGCALYRITVVLSIATVIATKFFVVGIALGAIYFGTELTKTAVKLFSYLWFADETKAVRGRGILYSVLLIAGLIYLSGGLHLPTHVHATGVVRAEVEHVVRAKTSGTVDSVRIRAGQRVQNSDPLAVLVDPLLSAKIDEADSRVRQSEVLIRAYDQVDRARADQERESLAEHQANLEGILRDRDRLTIAAPGAGRVVDYVGRGAAGQYLARGDWVATIGDGRWLIEVLLDEDQIALVKPEQGDPVFFRAASLPGEEVRGLVVAVQPVGSVKIDDVQFTQDAGGDIQVNPYTSEAARAFFRVSVAIEPETAEHVRRGMTGTVRLTGEPAPLGRTVVRRLLVFLERLKAQ